MAVIGVTGGIASGKSTFCRALAGVEPARVFDSDACARSLLESDAAVRAAVMRDILPTAYGADGSPDRAAIRAVVFSDSQAKARLEAILHPRVRARRQALADEEQKKGEMMIVDSPLLLETGADQDCDCIVTVACSPEIQMRRAVSRGLGRTQVEKIVATQWDNQRKIACSDFVVWNDGSLDVLMAQGEELRIRLRSRFAKIKSPVS